MRAVVLNVLLALGVVAPAASAQSPPTPSPQAPVEADTAAPPPPPALPLVAKPVEQTVTLKVTPQQPVAPQPVQLKVQAVAEPVAPQPQTITLQVTPTVAATPVAAVPAADPAPAATTVTAKVHHPGLFRRAIGRAGDAISLLGQDRIYIPRPQVATNQAVVAIAPAVQQVQYVVQQPAVTQAAAVAAPVKSQPAAVYATPQTSAPRLRLGIFGTK